MLRKHLHTGKEEQRFADEFTKNPESWLKGAPESLSRFVNEIMEMVAKGRDIDIISESDECTTQEAADILHVSRSFVVKLLEEGHIPFHKVGHYRRVMKKDILEYDSKRKAAARKDFGDIVEENQRMGLYD